MDEDRGYSKKAKLLSWYYDVAEVVVLLAMVASCIRSGLFKV